MKKIIATFICLTISAPCFAIGKGQAYYPQPTQPSMTYNYHNERPHKEPRASQRTKTLGVVAGVAGIAMLISAITD